MQLTRACPTAYFFRVMRKAATQQRQARFWGKFLRLTRGRVTVLRALEVIAAEEPAAAFRDMIVALRKDLGGGLLLSEAMGRRKGQFSLSVMELIRTAERTGAWEEILTEIADGLADGTFE